MNRKTFLAMVLSSFLGGAIAIGGYSLIKEDAQPNIVPAGNSTQSPLSFTNYVFDSADFIVPEGLNFVYAAKSATPAVVHIQTTYSSTGNGFSRNPMEDFFKEYFGDRYPRPEEGHGAGSGVIFTSDGYIATNNHVVEGASKIEVLLNDNRSFEASLVGTDPDTDLALLKIEGDNLPTIKFGSSDNIQVGEWVLAIGNPYEFTSTVTAGIVSAKSRNVRMPVNANSRYRIEAFIQTDAAVNPGNSGGALVNLNGELVGINTLIASPTGSFTGYSFAVPSTLVKKVIFDLKDFGAVQRPLLGISIEDMSAAIAKENDLDVLKGVYIGGVGANSAADDAGLDVGDVIIAIDGKPVGNVAQLQEQVALNRPGDEIEVTFIRKGKTRTTIATLKNTNNTTQIVEAQKTYDVEGLKVEPVSDTMKKELNIESGVQLKSIENKKWSDANIKEGFIVTKIDRKPIKTPDDLYASLRSAKGQGILIEGIYPNGEKSYYGIGW
ncbi:Do family serine endopeptidase [Marinoscillum sp. MHG1-6]|uniref:Do family serine endopeptidase n=1 Tax=Marinoscillum sp. MHG1-6 TaxID=2959627 RepID=UPI0021588F00|nr:Do family serine endopeptidase [Marinoscillum sp. MHG1-6]